MRREESGRGGWAGMVGWEQGRGRVGEAQGGAAVLVGWHGGTWGPD